jgi:hypothetical protein
MGPAGTTSVVIEHLRNCCSLARQASASSVCSALWVNTAVPDRLYADARTLVIVLWGTAPEVEGVHGGSDDCSLHLVAR